MTIIPPVDIINVGISPNIKNDNTIPKTGNNA